LADLYTRTLDVDEERGLAGKLAGVLFLTAGLTAVLQLFLPGVEDRHWPWVVAVAVCCVVWALYCLTLARPEERGPWFWHLPAVGAFAVAGVTMAATGGAGSPARFYLVYLLFYVSYFYPPRQARRYMPGYILVALLPLLYDRAAIEEGYVAELLVLCPAFVILGWLIIEGKRQLVDLREHARALSLRDPLTELSNRRAMLEWLRRRVEQGAAAGLMLVDLDGFKNVNTVHGYLAGDQVLQHTARALRECIRSDDMVARLGGDEFAVLAADADAEAMEMLAERVLEAVRRMEARLELADVKLTASVGWVLYPADADTIDELIAAADFCLRGAKLTGKDRALSAVDWAPVPVPDAEPPRAA
jgi:diguanylate cyclase (GGDEF)-like protein